MLVEVQKAVEESGKVAIFHCFAGKGRTGFLLLFLIFLLFTNKIYFINQFLLLLFKLLFSLQLKLFNYYHYLKYFH